MVNFCDQVEGEGADQGRAALMWETLALHANDVGKVRLGRGVLKCDVSPQPDGCP